MKFILTILYWNAHNASDIFLCLCFWYLYSITVCPTYGIRLQSYYFANETHPVLLGLKVYFFFVVVFIHQKGKPNNYSQHSMFECLRCAEGCDECIDSSPCIASLNWVLRTIILVLSLVIIGCLPLVVFFTWKYGHLKVNLVNCNNTRTL